MALNFNIPMPDIANSFSKGFGLTDNLMKQILERNQLKQKSENDRKSLEQAEKHFNRQETRLGANSDLTRQKLQQEIALNRIKSDPKALFEFIQAIKNQGGNNNLSTGIQNTSMPNQNQQNPQRNNGIGITSSENSNNPNQQNQQPISEQNSSNVGGTYDNLTPDQQMMLQTAGIKIPTIKENPEHKRYADLQAKIQLENYKTEQRKALEQEKANLKNEVTRQKTIDSAKNDLPHLKSTLKALENMKKIAGNNPDLFGHNGIFGFGAQGDEERFAKTTDNPNAGAWQTYGLGPIVAAESKMSSKGNQLALKQAIANKPNFSENQKVAEAKIDASIKQIKQSIKENYELTGEKESNNKNLPLSKEESSLLTKWEPQLIVINPKWTAKNIKSTRDATGLSVGQVIDKLMAKGK